MHGFHDDLFIHAHKYIFITITPLHAGISFHSIYLLPLLSGLLSLFLSSDDPISLLSGCSQRQG